jgi:hypothetical protein
MLRRSGVVAMLFVARQVARISVLCYLEVRASSSFFLLAKLDQPIRPPNLADCCFNLEQHQLGPVESGRRGATRKLKN